MSQAWRPVADRAILQARAALLRDLRAFLDERGVLEVSTPVLSAAGIPDPRIPSIPAETVTGRVYLHTSPEFPMKRLLAAGSGDIYQICPVFRDGEQGPWHNPEFQLLEWYRLAQDERMLAQECGELIRTVLSETRQRPIRFQTYAEAFQAHAGLDPLETDTETLAETVVTMTGTAAPVEWERQDWLDLLGSLRVYPALGRGEITVLTDYPAEQAALARVRDGDPPTAARFEVFVDGIELANGFHELQDAEEQARRFEAENRARRQQGLPEIPLDDHLLAALRAGLPDCAGVALGVDRLLALVVGARELTEVLSFPRDRA